MSISQSPPPGDDDAIDRSFDETESTSVAIINAIAELEGIGPMDVHSELDIVLYDHVDIEAIEALLESSTDATGVVVSFEITGGVREYFVAVYPGLVTVERTSGPSLR